MLMHSALEPGCNVLLQLRYLPVVRVTRRADYYRLCRLDLYSKVVMRNRHPDDHEQEDAGKPEEQHRFPTRAPTWSKVIGFSPADDGLWRLLHDSLDRLVFVYPIRFSPLDDGASHGN